MKTKTESPAKVPPGRIAPIGLVTRLLPPPPKQSNLLPFRVRINCINCKNPDL